jgi:hypothetical protein
VGDFGEALAKVRCQVVVGAHTMYRVYPELACRQSPYLLPGGMRSPDHGRGSQWSLGAKSAYLSGPDADRILGLRLTGAPVRKAQLDRFALADLRGSTCAAQGPLLEPEPFVAVFWCRERSKTYNRRSIDLPFTTSQALCRRLCLACAHWLERETTIQDSTAQVCVWARQVITKRTKEDTLTEVAIHVSSRSIGCDLLRPVPATHHACKRGPLLVPADYPCLCKVDIDRASCPESWA